MSIEIRPENPSDILAIHEVIKEAFKNAPHASHTEQDIVEALRKDCSLTISLVAEDKGEVVGQVSVSPVTISDGTHEWYGIGPVSVVPSHQRQGIGSMLLKNAIKALEELGADGAVLLGEPSFYSRFGFIPSQNLELAGVPPEYFQALHFSSSKPQGTVTYHPAFTDNG